MFWLGLSLIALLLAILIQVENVRRFDGTLNKSRTDEQKELDLGRNVRTPSISGNTQDNQPSFTNPSHSQFYTMHEDQN